MLTRQRNGESSKSPPPAFHSDFPAVIFDNAVADGQTQSGSLADILRRKKRIKYLADMLRRDTGAVIFKFNGELIMSRGRGTVSIAIVNCRRADLNRSTGRQSVERI